MTGISSWEFTGTLLTLLTPLVAVPLTAITFYLRSLREQQEFGIKTVVRRVESVESALTQLRGAIASFERDYTTKEEWLRECMLARRSLEQLTETSIRLETSLHGATGAYATAGGCGARPGAEIHATSAPSPTTKTPMERTD